MNTQKLPDFIQAITNDYSAQISHTFLLHGNIYDFVDNAGTSSDIKDVLALAYDDNVAGNKNAKNGQNITRIIAFYNISNSLVFLNKASETLWRDAMKSEYGDDLDEVTPGWDKPRSSGAFVQLMNKWFTVSKNHFEKNANARQTGTGFHKELVFTIVITDGDMFIPHSEHGVNEGDRPPIVAVRNWAKDTMIGSRNRIIILARNISDLNESIRSELAVSHLVRKPNLEDRLEWITNYDARIKDRVKSGGIVTVGQYKPSQIVYDEEFSTEQFAIQSAGMNRRQLKDVIMDSWMNQKPISIASVRERKQRALDDEYAGMLDFKEPEFGFEQIGGHEHFKEYCRRKIITPLKTGNLKHCSRGVLLPGPPGVGKSFMSWALAKEAGLNFLEVDLGKVFGGLVGQTESNMRKLIEGIESAAPCIVFIDEIDSVLSSGRTSGGDSGTSARVFNSFMTWMSNPSRTGKIVVIAATNRPDLLDAALIRAGRFDTKIPILPVAKDDVFGKKEILSAFKKKHNFTFDKSFKNTEKDPTNGFGLLLLDDKRYWTGAEIEVLLKKANDNAFYANRRNTDNVQDKSIYVEDFNKAYRAIISNTGDVERQILLSLLFADDLDYVPSSYHELAINKKRLKDELGLEE